MNYRLKYGGMLFGKEERRALIKSIDKNFWPANEEVKKMELEAAKFLGMSYGVLANSGSSAGLLALCALELPKGSEVIIPAVTFPTIFNIILQCGLIPVVVDAKVGTYNLDVADVEKAITPLTRAIICVHAVGNPCDMEAIMKLVADKNIYVLEDNCDGWGGTINGKAVGSFGHISFTSFHAAHIVSMGQGGGVFTNDEELARKAKIYRDWGRQSHLERRTNGDTWSTLPADYDARFIYEKIGYNLSPLELQAAMGRVQLKKTKKIKALRKRNFHYLLKELSQFPDLIMPKWIESADPSWFSFPITCRSPRGPLVAFLEKNGIETRSLFTGDVTKHPAYVGAEYRVGGELNEAQVILHQSFWLPVHPRYSTKELKYMVDKFSEYYGS